MSEIPKDVEVAAYKAIEENDFMMQGDEGLEVSNFLLMKMVASAILAERERCAKIADKFAAKPVKSKTVGQHDRTTSAAQTGKRIASAIRNPV